MRRLLSSVCFCLASTALPAMAAQTYGLVIGIDEYAHIQDLDGAVNDADDIADALQGLGVTVTKLINTDADRETILGSWRALAEQMEDGDQLIVTYAGHGSNEPEHYDGNEEDGRDETLILSGFSPYGSAAGERIRDDEIAELIAMTPGQNVIFVADACHSGTLSRTINPVLGYRYVSHGKINDDPLPPPPPNTLKNDGEDDIELFLAAVDEADKVPEFLIDGEARGALSFAFAEGLRGRADHDGNNQLTKGEIEDYVRRRVRGISQGIQSPQVSHKGAADEVVVTLGPVRPPNTDPSQTPFADAGAPEITKIYAATNLPLPANAQIAADPQSADLRLEPETGAVLSQGGDTIALVGQANSPQFLPHLEAVIRKYQLAQKLEDMAGGGTIEMLFEDGDKNYFDGDQINVQVAGRQTRYVSLFNIGSNGQVAYLYPVHLGQNGLDDPLEIAAQDRLNLRFVISAPFGADHVVAIETAENPAVLRRVLASYDGSTDADQFWAHLTQALNEFSTPPNIAIFPFFSAAR